MIHRPLRAPMPVVVCLGLVTALLTSPGCAPKPPPRPAVAQASQVGHTVYSVTVDDGDDVENLELALASLPREPEDRRYSSLTLRAPPTVENSQGEVICISNLPVHRSYPHWLSIEVRKTDGTVLSSGIGPLALNATQYTLLPTPELTDAVDPESAEFDCNHWRQTAQVQIGNLAQLLELVVFFYQPEPMSPLKSRLKKGTGWSPEQLGFAAMRGSLEITVAELAMTSEDEALAQGFGPGPYLLLRATIATNETPLVEADLLVAPNIWEIRYLASIIRASLHPAGDQSRQIVFTLEETEAVPGHVISDDRVYKGTPGDYEELTTISDGLPAITTVPLNPE